MAYTDPSAKGRAAIANPLFGTTTDYVAALFTIWGDERARTFMNDMKKNGVKMTTSNGESADFVAAGQVDFSLVDSDDAVNTKKQGKPVEIIYPDQDSNGIGVLILPNARRADQRRTARGEWETADRLSPQQGDRTQTRVC